jgi:hypothetical protein
MTSLRGMRTEGPMAEEIDLSVQRPAEYMFETMVENLATVPAPKDGASKSERSDAA